MIIPFDQSIVKLGFKLGLSAQTKKDRGTNKNAFWRREDVSITNAWLVNWGKNQKSRSWYEK